MEFSSSYTSYIFIKPLWLIFLKIIISFCRANLSVYEFLILFFSYTLVAYNFEFSFLTHVYTLAKLPLPTIFYKEKSSLKVVSIAYFFNFSHKI